MEITYRELDERIADGAARLSAAGIGVGDRVVIAGENTVAWIVALLSTWWCGAIAVPLNSRLGRDQLPELLTEVAPALIFADESQRSKFHDNASPCPIVGLAQVPSGRLIGLPHGPRIAPRNSDPSVPALISFTSGTTSVPKGALISHASIRAGVESWLPHSHAGPRSITTVLVPLFHNTAYIDQVAHFLWVGGQIDLIRRFHTDAVVEAMLRRPPTFLVAVPSVVRILMSAESADTLLASCRCVGVGGSPMPSAWSRELARRWPAITLLHGYGLTEFTSLSHLLTVVDRERRIDQIDAAASVGTPVRDVRCQIRDDNGAAVPTGNTGEIWLSGPQAMLGYWRNPEATARAQRGGWLRTGDIGSIDTKGRLWISGRLDDVINRGGEKILPAVVEDVLCRLPEISEAAVVGIPDPLLGQQVVAAVTLRSGVNTDLDRTTARRAVGTQLPDYAWPSTIVVVDRFPTGATGKTDRRELTEMITAAERTEILLPFDELRGGDIKLSGGCRPSTSSGATTAGAPRGTDPGR